MGIRIQIKGFKKVRKIIERYPIEKIKEVGNQVEITARAIEKTAKQLVPVDTGRLRSSIRPYPIGWSLEKSIEARTHYAKYIEFGTRRYSGKPFMRPAFQKHKKGFDRAIKRILEK